MNKLLFSLSTFSILTTKRASTAFMGGSSTCPFGLTIVEISSSASTILVGALVSSPKKAFLQFSLTILLWDMKKGFVTVRVVYPSIK